MTSRASNFLSPAVLILISGCNGPSQEYELVSALEAFPESERAILKEFMGFEELRKVSLGPWQCYAPDEDPSSQLFCTHGSKIIAYASSNEGTEVSVPLNLDNLTFVSLRDNEQDGKFDSLRQDVTDEEGQLARAIIDGNLDGDADTVIDYKSKSIRIRIEDQWHEVTHDDERDGQGKIIYKVEINGEQKRVDPYSYPFQFETIESNNSFNPTYSPAASIPSLTLGAAEFKR